MSENKPVVIALVVVGLAVLGMIAYFATQAPEEPVTTQPIAIPAPEPAPAIVEPEPMPEPPPAPEPIELPPEPEPEPAFVLPLLDDSDQLIRDGIVGLTRHEGINGWITPNQLIRKFVAFVDGVANGQVVKEPVRTLAPSSSFKVQQLDDSVFLMDNTNYQRYDRFGDIVASVNARRSAEFYHLVKPLLQNAVSELGYRDRNFDDVVFSAIGRLLETPVIDEPVRLVRPVVIYEYESRRLEELSSAQKQLLRMGPRNTRIVQDKLRELALELRSILENE